MEKLCKKCGNIGEFSSKGRICKSCKKEYDSLYVKENIDIILERQREYANNHKEEKREYDKKYREENWYKRTSSKLKNNYNITLDDYFIILKEQDGKCAICNATESSHKNKTLSVDHCHTTGKIRGLLCHHCNAGLGQFRDNIEVLKNAIKYLKNNK